MNEMKNMNIKIDDDLKKSFLEICKANDKSGSQVIRDFIRKYVAKNGQGDLFK